MSKKQTYLYILAAGIILILAGFFMHISLITSAYHTIGKMVANPLVFGPAAVCAFIFMGNGRYWLINLACALIASLIIQYFVIGAEQCRGAARIAQIGDRQPGQQVHARGLLGFVVRPLHG